MYFYDIEAFMRHCSRKGLSPKTMASYEQSLRVFGAFLEQQEIRQTERIRHLHIESYISYLYERGKYTICTVPEPRSNNYLDRRKDYAKKISSVTVNNYLRYMSAFFNWCVEEEIINKNPIKQNDFIKVERKPQEFVTDADFKRLMGCMDKSKFSEYRDSVIIQLLLDTGMRCGECLATRMENVDLSKGYIYLPAEITKGRKGRFVFYSAKMCRALRRWIQYKDRYRDSEYLFCTNKGKPIQVCNFEANVRKYTQRVGLKNIHPHCFRNNFAKRFLMDGGDIYTLSKILGHSSVTVTEKAYLDISTDDLREMYQKHSPLENMNF